MDSVSIKDEEILFLIRKLNPNKAAGSDGISGQMRCCLTTKNNLKKYPVDFNLSQYLEIGQCYPYLHKKKTDTC